MISGTSWFTGQPVTDGISSRAQVTLSLLIGAILVTAVVSVVLGVWAAVKRGWVDKLVQGVSLVGFAIPNFLIAVGLVIVFAINNQIFQATGYVPISDSFTGWLQTVTLPIIALAIGGIAGVSAQVRGAMIDALRQDYVRTLRSRGLGSGRVVYKHVLRNAGAPGLAVLGLQFVGLIGGAIIVENVFAIPGLGQIGVTVHRAGRHPDGDGPGCRDRHRRRGGQSDHRSGPGLAQPEGACVMTEPNAMVEPDSSTEAGSAIHPERSQRVSLFKKLLKNPVGLVTMAVLALIALSAIFAPLLTSQDPNYSSLADVLGPARDGHPLGFDSSGHDVWSRLLYAGRFSIAGALLALVVAAVLGVTLGLIAGYYHGWFDSSTSWVSSLMQAMPPS